MKYTNLKKTLAALAISSALFTTAACQRVLPPSADNNSSTSTKPAQTSSTTEQHSTTPTAEASSTPENTSSTKASTYTSSKEQFSSNGSITSESTKAKNQDTDPVASDFFNLNPSKNVTGKGSPHDPYKIGEVAYFDGYDTLFDPFKAEIIVQETYRGSVALRMIKGANSFNPYPEDGYEYLVAQVLVKAIDSKNNEKVALSPYFFSLANGNDGRMYGDLTLLRNLTPALSPIDTGETSIGYVCFQVEKDDHDPHIVFLSRAHGGIWFEASSQADIQGKENIK